MIAPIESPREAPTEPSREWGEVVLEQMMAAKRRLEQANVCGPYSAVLGERDWQSLSNHMSDRLRHDVRTPAFVPPQPPSWAPAHSKWVATIAGIDVFLA